MMHVLDLFSGIGGFSLGLERAGMRTVAFCEIDPYCQRVLRRHWPDVPVYGDIRELTAARLAADAHRWRQPKQPQCNGQPLHNGTSLRDDAIGLDIDLICGGFPCQDISVAGKGAGIGGKRSGLWGEYARIIGEVRPRYVIVENVAAMLGRGLATVLGDLAALGFDAEWHCIPASAVGAPHRRDRVWIVAHSQRLRCATAAQRNRHAELGSERQDHIAWDANQDAGTMAVADGKQFQEQRLSIAIQEELAAAGCNGWWRAEPDVGRVAHGVPARVDRLRALGNAVVPQIPEIIGRAIMRADAAASYDGAHGHDDMSKSWNACLAAVRERVAAGGPGWEPK